MAPERETAVPEHLDVLIVGAGLSGIGVAYCLGRSLPEKSYAILEARGTTGGTWDLFRYPGIRSDSDLSTFGYSFKPWSDDKVIASGEKILKYLRDTSTEHDIDRHIRLHEKVISASWSTAEARWTVSIERTDTGERSQITCSWFFCASGYYRYDKGFTPKFEGSEHFQGRLVHPQHWPADLDYAGKRVVVIGSGATAVTLVPAMASTAAHVTMLQRTPSYVLSLPSEDPLRNWLRKRLPEKQAFAITRKKNIALQKVLYRFCRQHPKAARRAIRYLNAKQLPAGYPIDEHFNPPYNPWDQRLCLVADGDLFRAISNGQASVVTDRIARFTAKGIALVSGKEIEADVVVTATGLELLVFGGIALTVDGAPVNLAEKVGFKGFMLDGVPNFSFLIGYTNASWTLKVGLVCEHFCKLLERMDENHDDICRAERNSSSTTTRPLLDFQAGYVQRAIDTLPRQGTEAPWLTPMDFELDTKLFAEVSNEHLRFSKAAGTETK